MRNTLKSAIEAVAGSFPPATVQKKPAFPDLLNQPDLVIVPQPGRLISVFGYITDSSAKRVSYEAVEDVFEAKLVIGESSVVAGLMLDGIAPSGTGDRLYSVLNQIYDVFGQFDAGSPQQITHDFIPMLRNALPKADSAPLWAAERKIVAIQLKRFSEQKYQVVCDPARAPEFQGRRGEKQIFSRLQALFAEDVHTRIEAERSPYSLAEILPSRSIARFDFVINRTPVELVSFDLLSVVRRVRKLMAKARLLRYQHPAESLASLPFMSLLLIVDGNIAGPSRDPFRYARALVSAGWEIIHTSQLDSLPQLLSHGEF